MLKIHDAKNTYFGILFGVPLCGEPFLHGRTIRVEYHQHLSGVALDNQVSAFPTMLCERFRGFQMAIVHGDEVVQTVLLQLKINDKYWN